MKKLLLLLLLPMALMCHEANATHIMGADLEWEAVGKDSFLITLSVYRDCNGIQVNNSNITVSTTCGTTSLTTKSTFKGDVTPVCSSVATRCDSRSATFQYGIQEYELSALYVATNDIKNGCCEVYISWGQCCRNGAVTTGGANQNFYLEAMMNSCLGKSSPSWSEAAVGMGCLGRDQIIDNSVKTKDSVVYSCMSPMQSATTPTTWSSGYSACRPIYYLGFPRTNLTFPMGYNLDRATGTLMFRPMKVEQTTIATKVEYYHNGKIAGYITRDVQFIVIKCPNNNPPVLSGIDVAAPNPGNFTTTVCAGKKLCFSVEASDRDTSDTIRLKQNFGIPGATFTITNKGAAQEKGEFCWTPTNADVSNIPHRVMIKATDNACPTSGTVARSYNILVKQAYTLDLDLQIVADKCGAYYLKVKDKNGRDIKDAQWYENDSIYIGKGDSLLHSFSTTGNRKITVTVDDCITQSKDSILNVPSVNTLSITLDNEVVCQNEQLRLEPNATGATGRLSYAWQVDPTIGYTGATNNSRVDLTFNNLAQTENYGITVVATDTIGCVDSASVTVTSKKNTSIDLEQDQLICEGSASPVALTLFNGQGNWTGSGVSSNNLNLNALTSGNRYLLTFKLEDSLSCVSDSASIDYRATLPLFIGTDFSNCTNSQQTVPLIRPQGLGTWTGTGVSGAIFDPAVAGKGSYYLNYTYTDSFGCLFSDSILATVFDYVPSITVTDTVKGCSNSGTISVTAQPAGGGWLGPGVASTSNKFTINPTFFGSGDFTYFYGYSDSNACTNSDSTVVRIHQAPMAGFKIIDTVSFTGNDVQIDNETIAGSATEYSWSIGDPVFATSQNFNFKQPIDSADTFNVLLIARDTLTGCVDSAFVENGIIVLLNTSTRYLIKGLEIYPNPAAGVLNIRSETAAPMNLRLIGVTGKEVYNSQHPQGTLSIDISHLETGVYLLRIEQDGQTHTQLLMKE